MRRVSYLRTCRSLTAVLLSRFHSKKICFTSMVFTLGKKFNLLGSKSHGSLMHSERPRHWKTALHALPNVNNAPCNRQRRQSASLQRPENQTSGAKIKSSWPRTKAIDPMNSPSPLMVGQPEKERKGKEIRLKVKLADSALFLRFSPSRFCVLEMRELANFLFPQEKEFIWGAEF